MQNIGDKVDNTPGASGELTAAEFNDHKNELQEPITTSGQTLSNLKTPEQLSRSMFIYGTSAQSMVDAAPSANVIELTPLTGSSGLVSPDAYSQMDGLIVEFDKPTANTSTTVTVNFGQTALTLLGAKSLKLSGGTDPSAGRISGRMRIQFDVGSDYWVVISPSPFTVPNKNDVINGACDIWQENTTFTSIANNTYSMDMFIYNKAGTMVHDILRSTDTPNTNFNYSLHMDCTTAQGSMGASDLATISYRVEGYNLKKYVNNFGTLGFWVKATKTGTYCVGFINSGNDRSYVAEYTVNVTNTWEYKIVTLLLDETGGAWDYEEGIGLRIRWAIAAGSNFQTSANSWQTGNFFATSSQVNGVDSAANDFRLDGISFNIGVEPVSFDYYDIEKELARCLRYYEKSYNQAVFPGTINDLGPARTIMAGASLTTIIGLTTSFSVKKRVAPTIKWYSPATGTIDRVRDINAATDRTVSVTANTGEGHTGHPVITTTPADSAIVSGHWVADARL